MIGSNVREMKFPGHVRVSGGGFACNSEGYTNWKRTVVFTFDCEFACSLPRTWQIYVAGQNQGSITATGCPNSYYKLINYPPLPVESESFLRAFHPAPQRRIAHAEDGRDLAVLAHFRRPPDRR